jgi:hypothetical protein
MRLVLFVQVPLLLLPGSVFARCYSTNEGGCVSDGPVFIGIMFLLTLIGLLVSTWRTTLAATVVAIVLGYAISLFSVGLGFVIGFFSWFFLHQYFEFLSPSDDE